MKIERISENQIRCTLSTSDLEERRLKISELAYGSDKTSRLFHELMEQAMEELDFNAFGQPLIVEAVPLPQGSITLLITVVDEPEEVDTRFARFTEFSGIDSDNDDDDCIFTGSDDSYAAEDSCKNSVMVWEFPGLDSVSELSLEFPDNSGCMSSLYKDPAGSTFCLLLTDTGDADAYKRACSLASEYGVMRRISKARLAYLREHYTEIIKEQAIEVLRSI